MENTENNTVVEQETTPNPEGKTFTQAELDNIVAERLARERKKMPSADEMKAFNEWKKTSQSDAERFAEQSKELESYKLEVTMLKNQQTVSKSNCKPEFAEFVADRVSKMDGDFAQNLEIYKRQNPQYFGETQFVRQSSSPQLTGNNSGKTTGSRMNDIIRRAAGKSI